MALFLQFRDNDAESVEIAMMSLFKDRRQAGSRLAEKIKLSDLEKSNTVLIALPRGGVAVGFEIATSLQIPMDVLIVRKVGHPLYSEYGIGAVTEDNFSWLDPDALGVTKIPEETLTKLFEQEKKEVVRRRLKYRNDRPLVELKGKTVLIVDDGSATGVTARLAARFAKFRQAKKVILAIPVCLGTADHLREDFDEVICMSESSNYKSVGQFFRHFEQVTDEEVMSLIAQSDKNKSNVIPIAEVPLTIEQVVLKNAVPLRTRFDFKKLTEKLKNAKIVMLGESSHGTQEFYEWRRLISQELISQHGFNFIAVEGDWPACSKVNDFIKSPEKTQDVHHVFKNFERWPTWMWANTDSIKLAEWLKKFNEKKSAKTQAGFYGLDVYSFFESMDEVIKTLHKIDPEAAKQAKQHYACLEKFERDERSYAKSLYQFPEGCASQVVQALQDLLKLKLGRADASALFEAQQNARIVKNAEHYYSALVHGNEDSWNVRDHHMMETLDVLLKRHGPDSKAIVWAHNTHIGDYRATNMVDYGQVNIGGLAREEWGESQVALLGFGTYKGEVVASRAWDGQVEVMPVPPGRADTYEDVFHKVALELNSNSFFLWLKDDLRNSELKKIRGHRAIGVVYQPNSDRNGNYVPTSLSQRYDGFVFVDQTHALTPLKQKFLKNEIPETWPQGF